MMIALNCMVEKMSRNIWMKFETDEINVDLVVHNLKFHIIPNMTCVWNDLFILWRHSRSYFIQHGFRCFCATWCCRFFFDEDWWFVSSTQISIRTSFAVNNCMIMWVEPREYCETILSRARARIQSPRTINVSGLECNNGWISWPELIHMYICFSSCVTIALYLYIYI